MARRDAVNRCVGVLTFLLAFLWSVMLMLACASCGSASAQEFDRAVELARICDYEASTRLRDCAGFYYIGVKTARITHRDPVVELMHYSSMYLVRTERGERIKHEEPPAKLLEYARALLRGDERDPCPSARHWGGSMDAPRGRMVPARCSGTMANTFYALAKEPR